MKNNKSLGQHWLKDRGTLDAIASLAAPEAEDVKLCVEIGPGLGTLTSSLLRRFDKVLAVEFDQRLAHNLPNSFPGKNLEVINEDILKFDFTNIAEPYVVAGNIPYYITSPIITKLITCKNPADKIVILIQKEVAERAAPEAGHENILSLTIKNYGDAFGGPEVPRDMFTPPPKVDSQVLIIVPHPPLYPESTLSLAKIGFSSPRKKLISNLSHGLQLSKEKLSQAFTAAGIDVNVRPADLSLDDWDRLRSML